MENSRPPILYVVAGPPGVGKSTYAKIFIPDSVSVLNHDEIKAEFEKMNMKDYSKQAEQKMWSLIQENSTLGIDFGVELNLGFENHYLGLKKIHGYCSHYEIHLLLFFTDIYNLCFDRAIRRATAGGHEVEPAAIADMLQDTIRLLRKNIGMFRHVTFINVTYNTEELVYSGYYPTQTHEFVQYPLPIWVVQNFPELV